MSVKKNFGKRIWIMNKGDLYNILGIQVMYNHVEGFIFIY
jgi:hypothetical protein